MASTIEPKKDPVNQQDATCYESHGDVSGDSLGDREAADDHLRQEDSEKYNWRFWLVFLTLCLISFASALDSTIITTALPAITRDIEGQQQYVWIANSFVVASTAIQPLVGQMSNIFGRRVPMMVSVALFAIGSGVAGGSNSAAMMIAGRTVQGLGSGGLFVLVELITCDLVPLRERGKYLGIMLSTAAVGTTIGPLAGGGLAQVSWRWVFYISLPVSGTALITMIFFLRIRHEMKSSWKHALARVDYVGNLLFIASLCAILVGLILGGTTYPWSSWKIIVPLVLGCLGWACFHLHQASRFCKEPSMPPRLFTNRTSLVGFILAFNSGLLLEWVIYFLPLYFQAVREVTPLASGVDILPLSVMLAPFAIVAGILLSKLGRYRPLHWTGFAFTAIGCGLFSILDSNSSKAAWVCFQIVAALGLGFVMTTILPSIQAALPESDTATATSTFAFVRSFGFVWGITIPSIVFQARFDALLGRISDEAVRSILADGRAYGYASASIIGHLPEDVRAEVLSVYTDALRAVWQAAIAFSLASFVVVFLTKHIELRKDLETEFGLEEEHEKISGQRAPENDHRVVKADDHRTETIENEMNRAQVAKKISESVQAHVSTTMIV
jgi:MFS family permease